jgi:hypothetical protein
MYRVRRQVAPPLTREEMFHVPFELRHKIAPQRYSIPGLPSLYLGGSLYTCWVEMRQPVFADLPASCLWLRPGEQLRYVDFAHRPRWLCTWLSNNGGAPLPQHAIDYIVSHLVCWPLMAVASVRTKLPIGSSTSISRLAAIPPRGTYCPDAALVLLAFGNNAAQYLAVIIAKRQTCVFGSISRIPARKSSIGVPLAPMKLRHARTAHLISSGVQFTAITLPFSRLRLARPLCPVN